MQKTCVVTGGANGIGRCITEEFIKNGYIVAVIDTDSESREMLKELYGPEKLFLFQGDIAEQDTLDEFVKAVTEKYPSVQSLINNACKTMGGLTDCEYDEFNYALRIGISAPFYLTKRLLPYFSQGASIVNIASTRAFMSMPGTESYSAAKGGIIALTHALAATLSGRVRVNSISPGWIDTGAYQHEDNYTPAHSDADRLQHPSGRIGAPKDIAEMALYLCGEHAGFITGENIVIDGGMSRLMIYHGEHGWKYEIP